MYMINEVSRKVNLSQKRIREYEKEGFINPDREMNTNNRLYTDFEIDQIVRINFLIHERGFTLACLKNLLVMAPCWNVFGCKLKEDCAAYEWPRLSCWKVRENHEVKCPGPCDKCAIFINRSRVAEPIFNKDYETNEQGTPSN